MVIVLIRTFSQVNDEVVIPKVRMGLTDFIFIFFAGMFGFFGLVLMTAVVPGRMVLLLGLWYYGIFFVLFFRVRSAYIRKGNVNVLWRRFDYIFQARSVWRGRDAGGIE
jgi:hypothetical protein